MVWMHFQHNTETNQTNEKKRGKNDSEVERQRGGGREERERDAWLPVPFKICHHSVTPQESNRIISPFKDIASFPDQCMHEPLHLPQQENLTINLWSGNCSESSLFYSKFPSPSIVYEASNLTLDEWLGHPSVWKWWIQIIISTVLCSKLPFYGYI